MIKVRNVGSRRGASCAVARFMKEGCELQCKEGMSRLEIVGCKRN